MRSGEKYIMYAFKIHILHLKKCMLMLFSFLFVYIQSSNLTGLVIGAVISLGVLITGYQYVFVVCVMYLRLHATLH